MMREQNAYPNAHTFAGVFTSIPNLQDALGVGKQAHSVAVKIGGCADVFVGTSLLNMYCKLGLVLVARKVFDRMPERNSVSWAAMISGYAVQRDSGQAMGLFRLMTGAEKERVNEFVLTSVLIVSVGNAIVTMYGKCGSLDDAVQAFELLSDKNAISWSAMITGFSQSGDPEKALKLFSKMHFSGMMPSEYTLVGVLNACSDISAAGEGKQVHGYLVKLGFESQIYIMTALVDMYAKSGCVADARKGFDYLKEPDIVFVDFHDWREGRCGTGKNDDEPSRVNKEPGCSWIELKSQVHVFVVGDQMHPQVKEIRTEVQRLSKIMKDEGYQPNFDLLSADIQS
ncbi:tetratricopeptide repeat (TPR)-like superfamily protein [Actinidia rufa]|uniref:Tetratricopeptide repeat (TPR)-like superfamily protein n=1 Tax=Actinidia rufa TaxID=165716 RepID=A0A7J0EA90_9ERIC|nr:tetratricopeptide repeat (TPR)-like superfamily protein [Actinidia rufa]